MAELEAVVAGSPLASSGALAHIELDARHGDARLVGNRLTREPTAARSVQVA